MPLISAIIALVFLGVALYLINLIPMEPWVKQVIRVLAILFIVLWLLPGFVGAIPIRWR